MINKQKYTLSQVENIIDSHIESDRDFTFICGFELAHYIYDYLGNEYGVEANSVELSSEIDEYYVSMSFYKDGDIDFFCEYAKWDQDETYKYSEGDNLDYFVFTDMSFGDVREFLGGKDTKVVFCELVDEDCENGNTMEGYDSQYDVSPECANCVGCDEHCGRGNHDDEYECEDNELEEQCECPICQAEQEVKELDCFCEECSEDYMKEFINECLEYVFNGCQECAIESVVKLAFKCKELGIESAKQDMIEFLEG